MSIKNEIKLTRRDFIKGGSMALGGGLLARLLDKLPLTSALAQTLTKRIYLAPDDHTDYFWAGGEFAYRQAFLDMIDYYLNLADTTQGNASAYQSRFNCDGSFWLWTYEKNKPAADYQRLIGRIRDGHLSFPLNALVLCLGGAPAEAVLRGMYYAGKVERREGLRFSMAISMENQTLPYGLVSLWAGAGARYSWKGVCGCDTQVTASGDRQYEIYWWQGLDGNKILMKWNSMLVSNQSMGGYAEARNPSSIVDYVDQNSSFKSRYPYSVIGCFGKGWDDFKTTTSEFVTVAQNKTTASRQVIVSNEQDFFADFEKNYGNSLPSLAASFGNEWDLYIATLSEISASVKRSVEKLRGAEALAALVSLQDITFMNGRTDARDLAWMDLGLYWEHNFGMASKTGTIVDQRLAWQRRLDSEIKTYVDTLASDAVTALGGMIQKTGSNTRFFAFNSLSWIRSDYVDYPVNNTDVVHVIDLTTGQETPSQYVTVGGQTYLRVLADGVPAMGYKVFEIQPGAGQAFSDAATVNGSVIENQFYQVTLSARGAITSWVDKMRSNRQFVRVIGGRAINDLGNGTGTVQVENAGPVSVTLLATSSSPIAHTTRITFIRNSERVQIQNDINQNFGSTYTWDFGFEVNTPDVWHEEVGAVIWAKLTTQGGHYSPRANNSRYDWLTLNHFADISDGSVGVTLSNADCYFMKLGNSTISTLDTATPQIHVLAGGSVVGAGWGGISNQGGDTHFLQRFALTTHDAYDQGSSMRFALEHQNPLIAGTVTGGSDYPGSSFSLVSVNNPDVLIWALKPSDDDPSDVVICLWNLSKTAENFSLGLNWDRIVSAQQLTHIETPLNAVALSSNQLAASMNACQMKTYAVLREGLKPVVTVTETPSPYLKSVILTSGFLDTQIGSTTGTLNSLGLLEQSGSSDTPSTYVVFSPTAYTFRGYQSFLLPEDLRPVNVSSILLQINYKDPVAANQWIWSVYYWPMKRWVELGDAPGGNSQWSTLLFRLNTPWKYISSAGEVRIQLSSDYATSDIKVDYEALHVTYKTSGHPNDPFVPTVLPDRPGIL
ncbi:MAG: hypothetical protein QM730_16500 [Anaerolineales bacterium]